MRKFWYRRILIMILVLSVSVGGSYCLLQLQQSSLEREVAAEPSETMVIPGGMPVGIYLETDGVMVLGTEAVEDKDGEKREPAAHLVKEGDYIVGVEDDEIKNKSELIAAVKSLEQPEIVLKVRRKNQKINIRMRAVECSADDYKLGIWVRDNAQGLGTITYLTADSTFGALGHGIHDIDTGELLKISRGVLYSTSIQDVQKGTEGYPGGMEGIIVYNSYNMLGRITENTEQGIYGELDRVDTLFRNAEPVKVAGKDEIEEGDALIRCAVDGYVKEYHVQITEIDRKASEINKRLEIAVTDPELLDKTGGIVQGMSGSPILQNGKLVGAVTHVFVNSPTKGYGIILEDMLKKQ